MIKKLYKLNRLNRLYLNYSYYLNELNTHFLSQEITEHLNWKKLLNCSYNLKLYIENAIPKY